MAEEQPNPLIGHVMNLVEGRQQTELAKLTILTQIAEGLSAIHSQLQVMDKRLEELVERSRK